MHILLIEKENLHSAYQQFKIKKDQKLWTEYKYLKSNYEKNEHK